MSEEEYYYSDPSISPSLTPSTTNGYAFDNEQNCLYDDDFYETHYVMYQQVEEVPVVIPKSTKKIVWKKPFTDVVAIPKSRKRSAIVKEAGEEAPPILDFYGDSSPPAKKAINKATSDKEIVKLYLDDIQKRGETFKPKYRSQDVDDDEVITKRLETQGKCNVSERRCIFPTCGRRFISLEVLAYHMGYAHQQFSVKRDGPHTCMICGLSFKNGKGKFSHMNSAHKDLAAQHERICLLQGPICLAL